MGPDRAQEMAAAMQMHLDERKAQAGTLANQGGALMEAAMMGAGEAYNGLSMPMRPYDKLMQSPGYGQPPAASVRADMERLENQRAFDDERMMQSQLVARNPELGMREVKLFETPQAAGIAPSAEWLAASDKQLSDLESAQNQQAFQRAMRKAAMKVKKQQYSDEYGTPEAEAERNRLNAELLAKRNAS